VKTHRVALAVRESARAGCAIDLDPGGAERARHAANG